MDASLLINRPPEVTRSTVQKAVVAIINEPRHFGQLREKLSIVTSAWFAQRYGMGFGDSWLVQRVCPWELEYVALGMRWGLKDSRYER